MTFDELIPKLATVLYRADGSIQLGATTEEAYPQLREFSDEILDERVNADGLSTFVAAAFETLDYHPHPYGHLALSAFINNLIGRSDSHSFDLTLSASLGYLLYQVTNQDEEDMVFTIHGDVGDYFLAEGNNIKTVISGQAGDHCGAFMQGCTVEVSGVGDYSFENIFESHVILNGPSGKNLGHDAIVSLLEIKHPVGDLPFRGDIQVCQLYVSDPAALKVIRKNIPEASGEDRGNALFDGKYLGEHTLIEFYLNTY